MTIINSIPFSASRNGLLARALSAVDFKLMQALAAERLKEVAEKKRQRARAGEKHPERAMNRKANARLTIRQADYDKGTQAQRHDRQSDRWTEGGYHRPGSLQK